jgi:hypothetical protein
MVGLTILFFGALVGLASSIIYIYDSYNENRETRMRIFEEDEK